MTPELTAALADLAVAIVSLALTVALPIVTARVYRWTGLRIEEKHQRALHEAAMTWAQNAVARGPAAATAQAGQELEAYLRRSVPDALRALAPSADVLVQIAGRYLRQAGAK